MNENGINNQNNPQYGTPLPNYKDKNLPFYKEWWFFALIPVIIFMCIGFYGIYDKFDDIVEDTVSNSQTNEKRTIQVDENKVEQPIEEFEQEIFDISKCEEFVYREYLRNPDDYIGNFVKVDVLITQVFIEDTYGTNLRYYQGYNLSNDEYYLIWDKRNSDSERILENDVITAYGEFQGVKMVELTSGKSKEVLSIVMKDSFLFG